jgi:hypothetical protein
MRNGVIDAYADSLAPVFLYMVPFVVIAFVLALLTKQIKLSDEAGMVARGEAVTDSADLSQIADEPGSVPVPAGVGESHGESDSMVR